jgi:hypothetical protein
MVCFFVVFLWKASVWFDRFTGEITKLAATDSDSDSDSDFDSDLNKIAFKYDVDGKTSFFKQEHVATTLRQVFCF